MRLKKAMALVLSFAMGIGVLSGCGKSENSSSKAETSDDNSITSSRYVSEYGATKQEMGTKTSMEIVNDMKIGWNLGNTMEATGSDNIDSEVSWQSTRTSKEMIDFVKESGFNVLRIPVTWQNHMDADFNVDEAWMDRVQEVVDYGIANDMYVIINAHHEDWYIPKAENVEGAEKELTALWTQIANRFANYDEHLIFEGLNEPRLKGEGAEWTGTNDARDICNQFAQTFVDAVRATGGNNETRSLMVTGYAASSSMSNLSAMVLPEDDHIIVSVHAYLPYSMALDTKGTDKFDAEKDGPGIDSFADSLYSIFVSQGIPVIVGEFGSVNKQNEEDRIACAKYYLNATEKYSIPCIMWDNAATVGSGENFGVLDRMFLTWNVPELITAMMEVAK